MSRRRRRRLPRGPSPPSPRRRGARRHRRAAREGGAAARGGPLVDEGEHPVEDLRRARRVVLRVREKGGVVEGAGEGLLRRGPVVRVVADGLPDPDAVAARIGHEELPYSVRHVLERPDARQSPGRYPSVGRLETGAEGLVQPVHVVGDDVTRTDRRSGVVLLQSEELELDAAALHDGVRVGALLPEGHLEPEGGVEIEHRLEGGARQDRNRLLGHALHSSQI